MYRANKIALLGLVIVVSVGFSMMNVDKAYGAPRYLGEHCWEGGGAVMKLGMTLMGDGHVSFCGSSTCPLWGEYAISGNLEVVGNQVVATGTGAATSYGAATMMARVSQTILDFATLNGMMYIMDMTWDGTVCSLEHYSTPIYYVPCETDGSQDGADKKEELIRFLRSISEEHQQ